MPKQKLKTITGLMSRRSKRGWLLIAGLLIVAGLAVPNARSVFAAKATCSSITECSDQIDSNNNAVADLVSQAVSYQDAISRLNSQITQLQKEINYNRNKQAGLETQIATKQIELNQQKTVLASDLTAMYVNGQMTPIEMLASSNNLSAYIDKQEAYSAVQNKIQDTLQQIATLQQQLQTKKAQVEALISEEDSQQSNLAGARNQQSQMLNYNKDQQASYNAQTEANQSRLNALIAAQRAANETSSPGGYYFLRFPGSIKRDPINGSYPYAHSGFSMSTAPGCNNGDGPDQWGYCTRQCVSYAAWAVYYSGRSAPMYYGSAKNWVYAARRDGVPFDATPRPGDVAISTEGTWGHAMYVEAVSGDQIYVSQYNQQLSGQFSTQWRTWE